MSASAPYRREHQAIFDDNAQKIVEYRLKQFDAGLALGWEFSHQTAISLGIDRVTGEADIVVGDQGFPEPDYDDGGLFVQFRHDSFNERDFPSSGMIINLWGHQSLDSFGADGEYRQWQLDLAKAISFGNHSFVFGLRSGTTSDGGPTIGRLFQAGGGPTLLGLEQGQLLGEHLAVAQFYYYREYKPIMFLTGYVGTLLEYGGAYATRDDINSENSVFSGSVFVAIDTPIGPLQFGIGATDLGGINYYTRIGHLF